MQHVCHTIQKEFLAASTLSSWLFLDYRYVMCVCLVLFFFLSLSFIYISDVKNHPDIAFYCISPGRKNNLTLQRAPHKYHVKISHLGSLIGKQINLLYHILYFYSMCTYM